jgi:hypothetical protein
MSPEFHLNYRLFARCHWISRHHYVGKNCLRIFVRIWCIVQFIAVHLQFKLDPYVLVISFSHPPTHDQKNDP